MKRFLRTFAIVALMLGTTALTAQAQRAKQFGLVAGVDFSSLTGDHIDQAGTRTGFTGGLFVGIPIGEKWTFEPELLYAMKGGSDSYTDISGTAEEDTYSLDYIQIPLLFRFNAQPNGGFYVFGGPSVSIPVTCGVEVVYDGETIFDDSCDNMAAGGTFFDEYQVSANTVISGTIGMGFSKGRVGIEGRYSYDWGNALTEETIDESLSVHNSVWLILLRFTK